MTQEIEIEFKNMITDKEYISLLTSYQLSSTDIKTQKNDYFDSAQFTLRDKGAALRVRQKKNDLVLTLKEPAEEGLLETHQVISEETFQSIKETGELPKGDVSKQVIKLGLTDNLLHLGSLTTHRAEVELSTGLLVLDHSEYLGCVDYELEFEVTNYEQGERAFHQLLEEHGIEIRKAKNKIQRFFLAKQKQI
ncbi:CYTH domain-containing protein [Guptibacillus algicola]|uniref:CYTH domain-containing protein n=1 Tax=Guptibacillus algicola TaxID=225844 RepID=UPI001CD5D601|nr:CYTH domain-containing protein [Alkalihalobacillus algicola]MCA0987829.1 CYTH domain-containing protein [Alkalihalobacillus algicola]